MKDGAIAHSLESGIAEEQVLHHLPGVIVALISQIDAQPLDPGEDNPVSHFQAGHIRISAGPLLAT
jgi:hypothetical protein